MKNFNEAAFMEVVKSGSIIMRHYCEWLFGSPSFGAQVFRMLASGWGTTLNADAARAFPETYKMLERHYADDPELVELQKKLNVRDKEHTYA